LSYYKFSIDKDLNVFAGDAFKDFRQFLSLPSIYAQSRSVRENVADMMALLKRVQKTPVSQVERQEIEQWLMQHQPESLQSAVDMFGDYLGQFRRGRVKPRDVSIRLKSFLEKSLVVACVKIASDVFIGFQKDFVRSKDDIFYSDPPFSHLADLAVNYEKDFQLFLQDIDRAIERSTVNDSREAKIELMTALRTKGREFDTVIVLDVNDGIFPNKMARDSGRIEEERRLFYVTVTRTKNNLLLFDSGRIQGQKLNISPFIDEMSLPDSSCLSHPQVDRISRELLDQLRV
jgi:DNA helicase-2/ATP-dependent DNA helicase PcrA